MKKLEIAKRYLLFIIGLFFSALGVACTKHAALGVSPISSVPNILNLRFSAVSMGNWLIIWNCLLIVGQILILRRCFQPIQMLQVPLSFLFGYFTDFGLWCVSVLPANVYLVRLALVLLGVVLLGFGISLTVIADVIMNAGEAFVKAVSDQTKKEFGNVKIVFDITNVALSVAISLLLFGGSVKGTREGTVIAALCTGMVVKFFTPRLRRPLCTLLRLDDANLSAPE